MHPGLGDRTCSSLALGLSTTIYRAVIEIVMSISTRRELLHSDNSIQFSECEMMFDQRNSTVAKKQGPGLRQGDPMINKVVASASDAVLSVQGLPRAVFSEP